MLKIGHNQQTCSNWTEIHQG